MRLGEKRRVPHSFYSALPLPLVLLPRVCPFAASSLSFSTPRANCGCLGANTLGLRGQIWDPTIGLCCHNGRDCGSTEEVDVQLPLIVFLKPFFLRGFWSSEVTQPLGNHGATAISEHTCAPLGSGVVSPPLEVEKAVRTLSGIFVIFVWIVRPLIIGFAPHWPVIGDSQAH
jgi:hypothetical protein